MIGLSAPINTASSGNTTIVPAVTGYKIKVIGFFLVCGGSTNVKFTDGAGGANLTGQMNFVANTGISLPSIDRKEEECWFNTSTSTALVLSNSAAEQVGGVVRYFLSTN